MAPKYWPAFSEMKLFSALNSGRFVLVLLGLVLTLAGGFSEWLHFPLSAKINAFSLSYGERSVAGESVIFSQGAGFLILIIGALAAALIRQIFISQILLSLALVALLYFPIYLLFVDTSWTIQYIWEADQYNGLRSFLAKNFIPNTGVEFPTTYLTGFEYLLDRFMVVLAVTSWGWFLAGIGILMIMFSYHPMQEKSLDGFTAVFLSTGISLILAILIGFNEIFADYLHSEGDSFLTQGDYADALDNYAGALTNDPALQYSELFLLNVSTAYLAKEGRHHPFSQVYVSEENSRRLLPVQAALNLEYFVEHEPIDSVFLSPLLAHSVRKLTKIYLKSGGDFYSKGQLAAALSNFEKALNIDPNLLNGNFFQAKVLLDLRKHEECKGIMEKLIEKVSRASIKANFYSTLAECLTGMGEYNQAREAYFSSYKLDDRENYWALRGLSGT
ncbi:MAG: tetratricopeptide repeat protein [Methylosarcina sp.]